MGERIPAGTSTPANDHPATSQQVKHDEPGASPERLDQMTAAGLVNTSWSINFRAVGGATGSRVSARTPATSLYLDDLKVAPDGEPGQPGPPAQHFRGVTRAPTGAAFVGSFAHPKDRAGMASAAVSFGGQPRFDFTVTSGSSGDLANARRQHGSMLRELTAELDDFVDEHEAQASLDRILAAHLGDSPARGVVRRIAQGTGRKVNTSDLHYGPVSAPRSFRLLVDVPTAIKDKSISYSTTENGETLTGQERTTGTALETETTDTTSIESQRLTQIENSLSTGIRGVFDRFFDFKHSSESATFTQSDTTTESKTGSKLNGEVKGVIDLIPDIPVIGWLARKLIGGKLEINLAPTLDSSFTVTGKRADSSTGKGASEFGMSERRITQAEAEQFAKHLTSTSLKSAVTHAIKAKRSSAEGEKQSGASKASRAVATSTTVGSVHLVATSDQPNLLEE